MKKKHTYQAAQVQQVRVKDLLGLLASGCIVAVDVAKMKMLVALATMAGEVVKLFRFEHPTETSEFLRIVTELRAGVEGARVVAAMEPTGTYGDALRHQLEQSGVRVFMVSPKRTHDSKEVFDGVPSLHDAKSAVLIAKLHGMGLSTAWQAPPQTRTRLRALVDLRQHEQHREEECHGWLEGVLARHWPELGQWADVREQKSALHLLEKYPSPAHVRADPEGAKALLREASHGRLSTEAMDGVIVGARSSLGVPMTPEEERLVQTLAAHVLEASKRQEGLEREMRVVGKDDEVYARLRAWMGTFTAAVMVTMCDPRQYARAYQLEKAIGMNLREKSSGQNDGRLSITKRGPSLVRQMLYLFALRMIQADVVVRAWYERREGYTKGSRACAVVAVMRKLARAMFHVSRGSAFDASKLFDVRRLDLDSPKARATTKQGVATTVDASKEESATTATAKTEASVAATQEASAAAETSMVPPPSASAPMEMGTASKRMTVTARTTPRPIARSKTRTRPTSAASKDASTAPAKMSVAVPTETSNAAPSSSTRPSNVLSSSAMLEDSRPAAAHAVKVSTARERSVLNEETSASMSLAEVAAAAKVAAAACVRAVPSGASTKAAIPRTTPRPIARDKKRTQRAARAST